MVQGHLVVLAFVRYRKTKLLVCLVEKNLVLSSYTKIVSFEHEDNDTSTFEEIRPIISKQFTDRILGGIMISPHLFKAELVTMMSGNISVHIIGG